MAAYRAPKDLWTPASEVPAARPWQMGAVGFAYFPIAFLLEYGFASTAVPPAFVILVELLIFGSMLEWVRRRLGRTKNEYHLVQLSFGFVLWQGVFGFLLTLGLPYTLPLIAVMVVFFLRLRRAYAPAAAPPAGAASSVPPGALD
jgi:hypothetical protein